MTAAALVSLLVFGTPVGTSEGPNLDLPPSAVGEVSPTERPVEVSSPETRVALQITETFGSITDRVALVLEPSLSETESATIRERLLRSGILQLADDSQHRAIVRRVDSNRVELSTVGPGLDASTTEFRWPAKKGEPDAAKTSTPKDSAAFAQRRIEIRLSLPDTPVNSGVAPPRGFDPSFNAAFRGGNFARGPGFGAPSLASDSDDWILIRAGELIDDRDLALLLNDTELLDRIDSERRDARLKWRYASGGAAALSATAGAVTLLVADEDTDRRVLAGSFFVLSGLAIAAMLFDFSSEHVLSQKEAHDLVSLYNDRLRRELSQQSVEED